MSWFGCEHEWKTIKTTYAPPHTLDRFSSHGDDSWPLEKIIHGVTTVLQECQQCHEVRKYEMLGREEAP